MSTIFNNMPLLHGQVGLWDEIGTVLGIFSFVVFVGFLAWSNGNKRRKAQAKRRRDRQTAKGG